MGRSLPISQLKAAFQPGPCNGSHISCSGQPDPASGQSSFKLVGASPAVANDSHLLSTRRIRHDNTIQPKWRGEAASYRLQFSELQTTSATFATTMNGTMTTAEKTVVSVTLSGSKRRLLDQRLRGAATGAGRDDVVMPRTAGARTIIGPDQYNIWLDVALHPEEPTYNEVVTLAYAGELQTDLLEQAFNQFIARHESWRTSFQLDQGEVLQVIHPEVRIAPLTLIDLSHLQFEDADARSKDLATKQARGFLSLEAVPLIRATLVRLAPNDCRVHLVLSHLIVDGYCLQRTLLVELATLYNSLEAGVPPNLPAVSLQYADYTEWRRLRVEALERNGQLDYWRQHLAGELPMLRLPWDRSRPATMTHRGGIERFILRPELTEALRQLGKRHYASFYMTLLASFKTLLFRYSSQNDIVIGSVAASRRQVELKSIMGLVIDVFAVRSRPEASLQFNEYLSQIRDTLLESIDAAEIPLQRVVEALGIKRDLSHAPIFQTMFVLVPPPKSFDRWSVAATEVDLGATKYDLYVQAEERANETHISLSYSTDLFEATTIRRMVGHWQTLLAAIVAAPAASLGELRLIPDVERDQLLVRWNETKAPIPKTTLQGLVLAQAIRTPNAPAVSFEGQTLTYSQLQSEARHLAHALSEAGAAPETLAAVFLDRSHHLPVALLAVLLTGAAYMPLDPGTPSARVALCLEDGAPSVILTERSRLGDLPVSAARVLVLEDILEQPDTVSFIEAKVDSNALAYVIHTSGSTGRPKGVEVRHAGVVNLLLSMQQEPGFTADDILVAVTTVSFDIAVLELFLPLVTGGKVVIASRETATDPSLLGALIAASRATMLQATPATWAGLVGNDWRGQKNFTALCGGEALKRSLADRLLALGIKLWNVYGPTETTVWSTIARVLPGDANVTVGRPIANTTTYILDPQQQPVPAGVPGELYLGGIGVARGYRHRADLTAEKFCTPAVAEGARVYRTGDHALYREDGSIEIQGRADNQVKIRGYRIELEDVEVNLAQHPRVAAAAAKAWPDSEGGYRLCAYLTGIAGAPPDAAEIRQFLRLRVADYMIPSDIVALPSLPLTSNGKIDRRQLPEPERSFASVPDVGSKLQAEELRLAHIWTELLHLERIDASDNFFDLGGHSLLLLKMNRMVNKEFGIELPLTRLFQAPTVEKLAELVRELQRKQPDAAWSSLVPLNPTGSKRPLFLIHSLMLYGRLPAALGPDQPFFALQPLPFSDDGSDNYVERMLDDHLRQIKRIQPHGPYQIVGWCFAGWLAYEIARRLEAAGEEVSLLALLDSWCPYKGGAAIEIAEDARFRRSFGSRLQTLTFKFRLHSHRIAGRSIADSVGYARRTLRDLWTTYSVPLERDIKAFIYRFCRHWSVPLPMWLKDANVITYNWLRSYQVEPFSADITLVRPGDVTVPPGSDPHCGWSALTTGSITTEFVPGDRSTMFLGANLTVLAELLTQKMLKSVPY